MGVDLALCDICGAEYVLGTSGEHASDYHQIQVDDLVPIFDEHWETTFTDTRHSCGCGWNSSSETWNHHILRKIGEAALRLRG